MSRIYSDSVAEKGKEKKTTDNKETVILDVTEILKSLYDLIGDKTDETPYKSITLTLLSTLFNNVFESDCE